MARRCARLVPRLPAGTSASNGVSDVARGSSLHASCTVDQSRSVKGLSSARGPGDPTQARTMRLEATRRRGDCLGNDAAEYAKSTNVMADPSGVMRVIGWFSPNACRSKSIPYLRGRVGRGSGPRGIHTARSKRILKNGKLQRLASGLHLTAWREFVDDLWNIPAEHLGELLPIDIPLACQFIDFTSSKHILDLTTVDRLVRAGSHP